MLGWASKLFLKAMGMPTPGTELGCGRSVVCVSELLALECRAAIMWGLSPEATLLHLNFIFPPFYNAG